MVSFLLIFLFFFLIEIYIILGNGWLLYKQGNWYDGEWFEDQRHGKGLRQYDYGVRYKGEFVDGERCGQGIMLYQNNDVRMLKLITNIYLKDYFFTLTKDQLNF